MSRFKPGTLFHDRFSIIEELGAGGMGVVYHALQVDVDRHVALKVLNLERIRQPGESERFLREFQILSKLSHPHIMSFYSLGMTAEGIPYAVCEYLQGISLQKALIQEGKMQWRRALKICMQIVSALEFAHSHEVVHRDLKPANVMLLQKPEADTVKLIDFGLARIVEESSSQKLTFTGELLGTVYYMSPEQCQGKATDGRCDIYALACLLFELISGERLFDAENAVAVIHMQAVEDPAMRLKILQPQAPAELIELLALMLSKSQEERPALSQVRDTLQYVMIEQGVTASGSTWVPNSEKNTVKGSQELKYAAVFALLSLLATVVALSFFKAKPASTAFDSQSRKGIRNFQNTPHNIDTLFSMASELSRAGKKVQEKALLLSWWNRYRNYPGTDQISGCRVLRRIAEICEQQGHTNEADEFITKALALSKKNEGPNSTVEEGATLLLYSGFLLNRSKPELARPFLKKAAVLFMSQKIQTGTELYYFDCCAQLARIGEYQLAYQAEKQFLEQSRGFKNSCEIANSESSLGDFALCSGNKKLALSHYLQAWTVLENYYKHGTFPDANDQAERVRMPDGFMSQGGANFWSRKEPTGTVLSLVAARLAYFDITKARAALKSSIDASQKEYEIGVKIDGPIWKKLAFDAAELGMVDEAQKCAKNSLEAAITKGSSIIGDSFRLFILRAKIMEYLVCLGKTEEALIGFKKSIREFKGAELANEEYVLRATQSIARACYAVDDKKTAIELTEQAKKQFQVMDKKNLLHGSHYALQALLNSHLGLSSEATVEAEKAFDLTKSAAFNADEFILVSKCLMEAGRTDLVEKLLAAIWSPSPDQIGARATAAVLIERAKFLLSSPSPDRKEIDLLLKRAIEYAEKNQPQFGSGIPEVLRARLLRARLQSDFEAKNVPGLLPVGKKYFVFWN